MVLMPLPESDVEPCSWKSLLRALPLEDFPPLLALLEGHGANRLLQRTTTEFERRTS